MRKLIDKFFSFLNSRFVFILLLIVTFVFVINWDDLGVLDYVLFTTLGIYVLLLMLRLILKFINKILMKIGD
ncbi:hypothetical protein A6E27_01410 [Bacillus cereus]|nr:hypothetical protein A6E21_13585 [Bacillus cereus]RAT10866.1 hypothetical protein A6E27_01410 [Bacillus cereus]